MIPEVRITGKPSEERQEPQEGQNGKERSAGEKRSTGEAQNVPNTMQFVSGCLIPSSFKTEKEKTNNQTYLLCKIQTVNRPPSLFYTWELTSTRKKKSHQVNHLNPKQLPILWHEVLGGILTPLHIFTSFMLFVVPEDEECLLSHPLFPCVHMLPFFLVSSDTRVTKSFSLVHGVSNCPPLTISSTSKRCKNILIK